MTDLKRCLEGDKRAWDAFVDEHTNDIYCTVLRIFRTRVPCPDPADVMDVTQNVFVRLVKNDYKLLRSYNPEKAGMRTWLTIITRSTTLDFLKSGFYGARIKLITDEEVEEQGRNDPPWPKGVDIPKKLLTPRQEMVLRMIFEDDCGTDDVAKILGVNRQTVRSIKHQALTRLRDHYSPECA